MSENISNELSYVHIKDFLSKDICHLLTHSMIMNQIESGKDIGDDQCPNSIIMDHNFLTDTVLEKMWAAVEMVVGEELIPTYSYARVYSNGDDMKYHIDRPACEVSVTVQLGRSHHYAYPLWMDGTRFDLAEGDAIIYSGCDYPHWRNECNGPDGYYSGQIFLHYVRANGDFANEAGDGRWDELPFYRHRMLMMERK